MGASVALKQCGRRMTDDQRWFPSQLNMKITHKNKHKKTNMMYEATAHDKT